MLIKLSQLGFWQLVEWHFGELPRWTRRGARNDSVEALLSVVGVVARYGSSTEYAARARQLEEPEGAL